MAELQTDQDRATPPTLARRIFSLPTLISLALAGALLAFLATRLEVDLNATWRQLASANPLYLGLAVLVHYTTFLFRGLRWRLLLNNVRATGEEPAGVFQCSQLALLGWFANSVAWLRLGDAYRAYLYHEESGAPFVRTMGTILSERLLDVAIIVLLLALALSFLVDYGWGGAWTVAATAAALLGLLTLIVLFIAAARGRDGDVMQRLLSRLPAPLSGWLLERYRQFRDGAIQSLKRAPLAGLWGLLAWLAEIGRFYLVAQALGLDLSPALVVFATLANSLLTLVPTPGGVGAVEAGLAGLLGQLSSLATPAVLALVLVDRSISYLSVIVTGAVLFLARWGLRYRRRAKDSVSGSGLGSGAAPERSEE